MRKKGKWFCAGVGKVADAIGDRVAWIGVGVYSLDEAAGLARDMPPGEHLNFRDQAGVVFFGCSRVRGRIGAARAAARQYFAEIEAK